MRRSWVIMLVTVLVGLGAAGIWFAPDTQALGPILRLSADFKNFDGTETFTADPPPGILAFSKTVFVPFGTNTLYVTISATGDSHDGAAVLFACLVDGVFCNPGNPFSTVPGWVNLQKHKVWIGIPGPLAGDGGGGGGDVHDNGIYYTWCTPIQPGTHTIDIRLASSGSDFETGGTGLFGPVGPTVFFEQAHFYIDASRIGGPNQCTPADDEVGETARASSPPSGRPPTSRPTPNK